MIHVNNYYIKFACFTHMDYQYYDFEDGSKKHSGLIVVGKKEESWEVFLNMPAV